MGHERSVRAQQRQKRHERKESQMRANIENAATARGGKKGIENPSHPSARSTPHTDSLQSHIYPCHHQSNRDAPTRPLCHRQRQSRPGSAGSSGRYSLVDAVDPLARDRGGWRDGYGTKGLWGRCREEMGDGKKVER